MRILYLSQYFPPEAGATQTRAYEMARAWVKLGSQVTMLTEIPNHPSGIIPPAYRGKLYERQNMDGIDVIRVWVAASPVKNFRNRMLFYLSYMFNAVLGGIILARQPYDLIYVTSPPLFSGGAALVLSWLRRLPMVFEVRDLWPESAVALGELSNPTAIRLATRLEEACYRRSRHITAVTPSIRSHLIQRGISEAKLWLVQNGANVELFQFSAAARQQIRTELQLDDQLLAVYAGIFGIAQGLETLVEAARLLAGRKDIHILMIGDGPRRNELLALAHQYQLENLNILPEQPRTHIPAYLSAADIALVPLLDVELLQTALPSKIFDAWACDRPVITSAQGEARQVVEQAQGGWFVPPEDPQALAETLIDLKDQVQERLTRGANGRRVTIAHYSRQALAESLHRSLVSIIREG